MTNFLYITKDLQELIRYKQYQASILCIDGKIEWLDFVSDRLEGDCIIHKDEDSIINIFYNCSIEGGRLDEDRYKLFNITLLKHPVWNSESLRRYPHNKIVWESLTFDRYKKTGFVI